MVGVQRPGQQYNRSIITETLAQETFDAVSLAYFDEPEMARVISEAIPKMLDRSWFFVLPAPYQYTAWQPWLKGYNGELYPNHYNSNTYTRYVWIDQDLKEELTGRR